MCKPQYVADSLPRRDEIIKDFGRWVNFPPEILLTARDILYSVKHYVMMTPGDKMYDIQHDMYAVGIMMYELVCKQKPFLLDLESNDACHIEDLAVIAQRSAHEKHLLLLSDMHSIVGMKYSWVTMMRDCICLDINLKDDKRIVHAEEHLLDKTPVDLVKRTRASTLDSLAPKSSYGLLGCK